MEALGRVLFANSAILGRVLGSKNPQIENTVAKIRFAITSVRLKTGAPSILARKMQSERDSRSSDL